MEQESSRSSQLGALRKSDGGTAKLRNQTLDGVISETQSYAQYYVEQAKTFPYQRADSAAYQG